MDAPQWLAAAGDRLPGDALDRYSAPELAVFVSGVASMGLEILAGRIVAPEYGSSIYTWGSIIGVFLAALSLGYHLGGKRAAYRASVGRLAALLLATAAYVAVLIVGRDLILAAGTAIPLPSRYGSLPPVILLFGPPTYLLGYVSPYAAELSNTEGLGETSGRVYAVGTVGSIVGAFGTTFFLVPSLDVDAIGLLFGLLLVGTAAAITLPSMDRDRFVAVAGVTVLLLAAVGSGAVGLSTGGRVVYETETAHQHLEVADRGDTRTLFLDGQRHSAMDRSDPDRHVFEYTRYFHLPYLFADDPDEIERVLFVGGGGFTGPKQFLRTDEDVQVDVVEVDPEVVDVAEEYFDVPDSDRLTVHTEDGRQFLQRTDRTYDVVVLDAYKQDRVPFHLTTVEFLEVVEDRLSADGILVANLVSAPDGPASEFYRAQFGTAEQVFPQVYGFPTAGGSVVQNVELVATADPSRVSQDELQARNDRRDVGLDLSAAVENYRADEPTDDVPVLTDDHAPVDRLLDPMLGQRYVVERTAPTNATAG